MRVQKVFGSISAFWMVLYPNFAEAEPWIALAKSEKIDEENRTATRSDISDTDAAVDDIKDRAVIAGDQSTNLPTKPTINDLLHSLGYKLGNDVSKNIIEKSKSENQNKDAKGAE